MADKSQKMLARLPRGLADRGADDIRATEKMTAKIREVFELYGFEPVDIAVDRAGIGALARDARGRVMLLRRHGAHFVGRMLDNHLHVRLDRNLIEVGTGEKRFGKITLDLGDEAPAWAASLRRL